MKGESPPQVIREIGLGGGVGMTLTVVRHKEGGLPHHQALNRGRPEGEVGTRVTVVRHTLSASLTLSALMTAYL
jgi:hypothetical protein